MRAKKIVIISGIVIPVVAMLIQIILWLYGIYREANPEIIETGGVIIEQRIIGGGGGNGTVTIEKGNKIIRSDKFLKEVKTNVDKCD